jgi:hypothetical protein
MLEICYKLYFLKKVSFLLNSSIYTPPFINYLLIRKNTRFMTFEDQVRKEAFALCSSILNSSSKLIAPTGNLEPTKQICTLYAFIDQRKLV